MIPQPTLRISYIILTITLTATLISSPIIAAFSSSLLLPRGLKVEFAFATSSSENSGDNNEGGEEELTTDVITEGEEENDDGGDVQEEGATEEEQEQPLSSTQEQEGEEDQDVEVEAEEQEQLAFMAGEICDDFEDNDGDGLIDLADADCGAPLTQGALTAPTTPSPPPSVTNTNATNSTNNTLTASGLTASPPLDLEKDCDTYEELGIPDPPLSPGDPPDVQWYHCPPGVGVRIPPPVDTTTSANSGAGQGQSPPSSAATSPQPPTTAISQQQLQQQIQQLQQVCTSLQQQQQQLQQQIQQLQQVCTSLQALPTTATSQGAQQGQGQQPPQQEEPVSTKDPDDLVIINDPNGLSITWKRDGREIAKYPGGIERTTDPFGKSVFKYPGGIIIQCRDGSILNMPDDGKWTIIEPPPAADIGERLNRWLFGSDAEAEIIQYLPWDEFLWHMIPKPSWIIK